MATAGRPAPLPASNVAPRKFANRNLSSLSKSVAARALAGPRGPGFVIRSDRKAPVKGIGIVAAPTPLNTSSVRREPPRPNPAAPPPSSAGWRVEESPTQPEHANATGAPPQSYAASGRPAWTKESGDIRAKLASNSNASSYRPPPAQSQYEPQPHNGYGHGYHSVSQPTQTRPSSGYGSAQPPAVVRPERSLAPAPPRSERRTTATTRVIVGETTGSTRWGDVDSDEEEEEGATSAAPPRVAAAAVAAPSIPTQPISDTHSRPSSAQTFMRPHRASFGSTQDARAEGLSHSNDYESEAGQWSRRTLNDDRRARVNGHPDNYYHERSEMQPRPWRSRSRGMSMDEHPTREHQRVLDDEEEQQRALARARAEREMLERQRQRLRSADSDDMAAHKPDARSMKPSNWREPSANQRHFDSHAQRQHLRSADSDDRSPVGDYRTGKQSSWREPSSNERNTEARPQRESIQPRKILAHENKVQPQVESVAPSQPSKPEPQQQATPTTEPVVVPLATRSLVDPSRPYASMFERPAADEPPAPQTHDEKEKEEQTVSVEQLAHDNRMHDRQEHAGKTRKLYDHKSGQMMDAGNRHESRQVTKPPADPHWKRAWTGPSVPEQSAEQLEEQRIRKEEQREAKKRQAEQLKQQQLEEAQQRREARAKERAERGPRTKGVLFKYSDDGTAVRVLTATEEQEIARKKQERGERRTKLQEARDRKAKEKQKSRHDDRASRDVQGKSGDAKKPTTGVVTQVDASMKVADAVLANPPVGSGVVVVGSQEGILHDATHEGELFEPVKTRRPRQDKKEERKPRRSDGAKDSTKKFVSQDKRAELDTVEPATPKENVEQSVPIASAKASTSLPAQPAWQGRSTLEVLGVKPAEPEKPQSVEVEADAGQHKPSTKEDKKAKKARPQGVYKPKASLDALQLKQPAEQSSDGTIAPATIKQWKPKSSQSKHTTPRSELDHDAAIESIAATAESVAKLATEDVDDKPLLFGNEFIPSGPSIEQQLRDVQQKAPADQGRKNSTWRTHSALDSNRSSNSRWQTQVPITQPQQNDSAHETAISTDHGYLHGAFTHGLPLQSAIYHDQTWNSGYDVAQDAFTESQVPWGIPSLPGQAHDSRSRFANSMSANTWGYNAPPIGASLSTPTLEPSSFGDAIDGIIGSSRTDREQKGGSRQKLPVTEETSGKRTRKEKFKADEPKPKRLARSRSGLQPSEPPSETVTQPEATEVPSVERRSPRSRPSPRAETHSEEKKHDGTQRLPKRAPKSRKYQPNGAVTATQSAAPREEQNLTPVRVAEAPQAASAPLPLAEPRPSQPESERPPRADRPRAKREPYSAGKKPNGSTAPKRYVVKQPTTDKAAEK